MDAALGFGLGHALHAVPARLELQAAVGTLAFNKRDDPLVAPDPRFCGFDHIDLEPFDLGVFAVHAKQRSGKKRRLITTGPGADFEEQILLVSSIFGNKQLLGLLFDLSPLTFERSALLRCHFMKLGPGRGICKNLSGFLQLSCVVSIGCKKLGRRFDIRSLLVHLM